MGSDQWRSLYDCGRQTSLPLSPHPWVHIGYSFFAKSCLLCCAHRRAQPSPHPSWFETGAKGTDNWPWDHASDLLCKARGLARRELNPDELSQSPEVSCDNCLQSETRALPNGFFSSYKTSFSRNKFSPLKLGCLLAGNGRDWERPQSRKR